MAHLIRSATNFALRTFLPEKFKERHELDYWRKKHGQADDRSGFFVRFFDRKVAGLLGHRDARANYARLREIPLRLREHAKNKQSDVETAKARVAEVER